LTGNACRALISDRAINNHQVASAGQAAFVATRQNDEGLAASMEFRSAEYLKSSSGGGSKERQNGKCWPEIEPKSARGV
jgi:hypothetical protein